MKQPMSPTSVCDPTHSESSQTSSLEDHNTAPHSSETSSLQHPRLTELHKLARQDAEHQHAENFAKKMKRQTKSLINKDKNKRQVSNIRSAEICRATKGFYIERLEMDIVQEEETYLQHMKDLLDQAAENVRLVHKIQALEEKERLETETPRENRVSSDISPAHDIITELFPVTHIDVETMNTGFESENCTTLSEEDIELFINDEGHCAPDFVVNQMDVPVTPPPAFQEFAPVTPQGQRLSLETCSLKGSRSPVSVFDMAQQMPVTDCLRPSLVTSMEL